jgi:hypothetical protein
MKKPVARRDGVPAWQGNGAKDFQNRHFFANLQNECTLTKWP